ncbi:Uncharacterized protein APZ42_024410 [Daphnia magna]|uniref:Uncharacterized protein n=1 Tax=Daphnia magna TaxID=35525 RepID=A0A164U275_9CRUS|nr:Uncharacterized protein APZ42_024410 [Daphnia magna]
MKGKKRLSVTFRSKSDTILCVEKQHKDEAIPNLFSLVTRERQFLASSLPTNGLSKKTKTKNFLVPIFGFDFYPTGENVRRRRRRRKRRNFHDFTSPDVCELGTQLEFHYVQSPIVLPCDTCAFLHNHFLLLLVLINGQFVVPYPPSVPLAGSTNL